MSVRVYMVAKELGMANRELVGRIKSMGIAIANHMSVLDQDDVVRLKRAIEREKNKDVEEKWLGDTMFVRKRTKKAEPVAEAAAPADAPAAAEPTDAAVLAAGAGSSRAGAEAVFRKLSGGALEDRAEAKASEASTEAPPAPDTAAPPQGTEAVAAAPQPPKPVRLRPTMNQAVVTGRVPTDQLPTPQPPRFGTPRHAPGGGPGGGPSGGPGGAPGGGGPAPRTIDDLIRNRRTGERKSAGGKRRTLTRREIFEQQRERIYRSRPRRPRKGKKTRKTAVTVPSAKKRVIKIQEAIRVGDLAKQMSVKIGDVMRKLIADGTMANINTNLDFDTAGVVASEFGYEVVNVAFAEADILQQEAAGEGTSRPPVVTVMGHVDHGKTSLLDALRKTNVASGEAGGITQHIGAYQVETDRGRVTFIDTPGHHSFTELRKRGAQVTDIVVLVVAANDGVMPQTEEAIAHARDADVPIIVAVNKMDLPEANPERVMTQLSERGLQPEEWGGDTLCVMVSAKSGDGVADVLETIHLQAEVLELTSDWDKRAVGVVIEAKLDRGRGPVATVLITEGTLRPGESVVTGRYAGKVRALLNDLGENLEEATPGMPVEVIGLKGVPQAGDQFHAVATDKEAEKVASHRDQLARRREAAQAGTGPVTLETLKQHLEAGDLKELKIVLKGDVQGSVEAMTQALQDLSTEEVKVNVIREGVGGISEDDVNLAAAGGAIIVGFNVRPTGKVDSIAESEGVDIKMFNVIYEATDAVRLAMAGLLAPVEVEKVIGRAEVRETFTIPKVGTIAGCFVIDGKVRRNARARLIRDGADVYTSKLSSLRRFKDDVREVEKGFECGIGIENFNDVKQGDVIEVFEVEEVAAQLGRAAASL